MDMLSIRYRILHLTRIPAIRTLKHLFWRKNRNHESVFKDSRGYRQGPADRGVFSWFVWISGHVDRDQVGLFGLRLQRDRAVLGWRGVPGLLASGIHGESQNNPPHWKHRSRIAQWIVMFCLFLRGDSGLWLSGARVIVGLCLSPVRDDSPQRELESVLLHSECFGCGLAIGSDSSHLPRDRF